MSWSVVPSRQNPSSSTGILGVNRICMPVKDLPTLIRKNECLKHFRLFFVPGEFKCCHRQLNYSTVSGFYRYNLYILKIQDGRSRPYNSGVNSLVLGRISQFGDALCHLKTALFRTLSQMPAFLNVFSCQIPMAQDLGLPNPHPYAWSCKILYPGHIGRISFWCNNNGNKNRRGISVCGL